MTTSDEPRAPHEVSHRGDIRLLARGAGVSVAGKMAGRALHALSQVVLARSLGPAGLGLYAFGWTVLRVIGILTPLGLPHAVVKFGSRHRERPDSLRAVLLWSNGLALLAGVPSPVASDRFAYEFSSRSDLADFTVVEGSWTVSGGTLACMSKGSRDEVACGLMPTF